MKTVTVFLYDDCRDVVGLAYAIERLTGVAYAWCEGLDQQIDPKAPFTDLGFSTRTRYALLNARVNTVSDLVAWSPKELRKIKNFGKVALAEVVTVLARHRLQLKEDA